MHALYLIASSYNRPHCIKFSIYCLSRWQRRDGNCKMLVEIVVMSICWFSVLLIVILLMLAIFEVLNVEVLNFESVSCWHSHRSVHCVILSVHCVILSMTQWTDLKHTKSTVISSCLCKKYLWSRIYISLVSRPIRKIGEKGLVSTVRACA